MRILKTGFAWSTFRINSDISRMPEFEWDKVRSIIQIAQPLEDELPIRWALAPIRVRLTLRVGILVLTSKRLLFGVERRRGLGSYYNFSFERSLADINEIREIQWLWRWDALEIRTSDGSMFAVRTNNRDGWARDVAIAQDRLLAGSHKEPAYEDKVRSR